MELVSYLWGSNLKGENEPRKHACLQKKVCPSLAIYFPFLSEIRIFGKMMKT